MRPIKGKIIVKIVKEQWDELFKKKIKRDDGTTVELFINVEAAESDDRRYTLNIQSGEIISVADDVSDVFPGDIALLDYSVSSANEENLIEKNDEYELRCINAITTFHEKDEIAYANRRSPKPKDQLIARKGDYNQISPLLGIIRKERIIARFPYIFLHHESNLIHKVSASGLLYEETEYVYERKVLASGDENILPGDTLVLRDHDVFPVKISDKHFEAIFAQDILAIKEEL